MNKEEMKKQLDEIYKYGAPKGDYALEVFTTGMNKVLQEIEELDENEELKEKLEDDYQHEQYMKTVIENNKLPRIIQNKIPTNPFIRKRRSVTINSTYPRKNKKRKEFLIAGVNRK